MPINCKNVMKKNYKIHVLENLLFPFYKYGIYNTKRLIFLVLTEIKNHYHNK